MMPSSMVTHPSKTAKGEAANFVLTQSGPAFSHLLVQNVVHRRSGYTLVAVFELNKGILDEDFPTRSDENPDGGCGRVA